MIDEIRKREVLAKKRVLIHLLVTFPTLMFMDRKLYDDPNQLIYIVLGLILFTHVGARVWEYLESMRK